MRSEKVLKHVLSVLINISTFILTIYIFFLYLLKKNNLKSRVHLHVPLTSLHMIYPLHLNLNHLTLLTCFKKSNVYKFTVFWKTKLLKTVILLNFKCSPKRLFITSLHARFK